MDGLFYVLALKFQCCWHPFQRKFLSLCAQDKFLTMQQSLLETVTHSKDYGQPLLSNSFLLSNADHEKEPIKAYLYDKFILIKFKNHDKDKQFKINFHFDLIFELVRDEPEKKNSIGKIINLKFQRFGQSVSFEVEKDPEILKSWRDHLGGVLNQRGFHDLFKPIKKIGKGNFASVYLVYKHENGQKYACKAFSKEAAYSEENGKESLIKQIQIMRTLNHRNLMNVFEVYESQNSIYIIVELLEGGQLYDKVKARHKFTQKEIKIVMKGILEGLEVMHEHNIMHRDLKPENILLRKQGDYDCVIADFGLAQCGDEEFMFVRCGTPGYVAPEIVNLKDTKIKYGCACDLFSVGVIFHLLVLRKSPFPGRQYDDVLAQNRACKFNFEHQEYLNLPESWLDLMKKLLEKDPKKRISASEALVHDFFSKDEMFKEFIEQRRSNLITSEQCASPLMTSKNRDRKNRGLTRDDSCLKFKMKENIMTGHTDNCQTVDEIDSPANLKLKAKQPAESRFKKHNQ